MMLILKLSFFFFFFFLIWFFYPRQNRILDFNALFYLDVVFFLCIFFVVDANSLTGEGDLPLLFEYSDDLRFSFGNIYSTNLTECQGIFIILYFWAFFFLLSVVTSWPHLISTHTNNFALLTLNYFISCPFC